MLNDPREAPTDSIVPKDFSSRVATEWDTFSTYTCSTKGVQNGPNKENAIVFNSKTYHCCPLLSVKINNERLSIYIDIKRISYLRADNWYQV